MKPPFLSRGRPFPCDKSADPTTYQAPTLFARESENLRFSSISCFENRHLARASFHPWSPTKGLIGDFPNPAPPVACGADPQGLPLRQFPSKRGMDFIGDEIAVLQPLHTHGLLLKELGYNRFANRTTPKGVVVFVDFCLAGMHTHGFA